jgi:hypothetical protein
MLNKMQLLLTFIDRNTARESPSAFLLKKLKKEYRNTSHQDGEGKEMQEKTTAIFYQ